jgi:NADPH-dependent 2,4-dienoyl-CoA reductase/sulfur reductase-like enzyme
MRTLVIGAGPAGLEAATAADLAGFPTLVVDAGRIGAGVGTWAANRAWSGWEGIAGPAGRRVLGDPTTAAPRGRDVVAQWLEPLAARLAVEERTRVLAVGLAAEVFTAVLETADGERRFEAFDQVFDAAGAGPWTPVGRGGLPVPSENRAASAGRLRYGPVDPADLPPGDILVIGDHPAAAVLVEEIAAVRTVHWCGAARHPAGATVHPPVDRFGRANEGLVVFAGGDRFHVAQAVACTGHQPDLAFVRTLPWSWVDGHLHVAHPRYHLVGARAA